MFKTRKQKLKENFALTLACVTLTAAMVGAGLLGERWQHERQVGTRQVR